MYISQVSNNLYRGSRPKSYLDLYSLKKNIGMIIDLESGVYEGLHEDLYEYQNSKDFGIVKHNLKCNDFLPPSKKRVIEFLHLLDAFKDVNIFVHCLHGADRTGYMIGMYRYIIDRWSIDKIFNEMNRFGFHNMPYIWWKGIFKMRCDAIEKAYRT